MSVGNDERARSLTRMRDLFADFKNAHEFREYALASMRSRAQDRRNKRKQKIAWANSMVEVVRVARLELGNDVGPVRLSRWLNENGSRTHRGNKFRGSNLDELFCIDREIIADAVMECRARMSALALSADFECTRLEIHPLENDCILKGKKAILLARRLERLPAMSNQDLEREAIRKCAEEATKQREHYLPMMARDCYLTMAKFDEVVPGIERLHEDVT